MIDFFGVFSCDILYIVLGLSGFSLFLFLLSIISLVKCKKLKKKYKNFMEGTDGKSVEKLIRENLDLMEKIKDQEIINSEEMKKINVKTDNAIQKTGLVKYDAFHEMGGKLSFALCSLDNHNDGFVVNVMHSNDGCFAYIKDVKNAIPDVELGEEEQTALNKALNVNNDERK